MVVQRAQSARWLSDPLTCDALVVVREAGDTDAQKCFRAAEGTHYAR